MNRVLTLVLVFSLARCTCEPELPPDPLPPVGELRAVINGDSVELLLDSTDARVRVLTADVTLTGARAIDVTAAGNTNLVEDGLDAPNGRVTVVLADTRRVPLPEGAVARIACDAAPTQVGIGSVRAVDDQGRERSVTVVVP